MVEARAFKAGVYYCLVVFAAGLLLGVVRSLWIKPLAGEVIAVALEAPIMLAVAWYACGWVAERLDVSQAFFDRLTMGGVALAMLIGAEAIIAIVADGHSPGEYFSEYARSAILLGLVAQLAFVVFPMLRRRRPGA